MCIACINHILIAFGASWLRDIFYAASKSPFDIIAEREKRIGAKRNTGVFRKPGMFFFGSEYRRLLRKCFCPYIIAQYVHIIISDVEVDGVVPVCPFDVITKLQVQYLRRLARV